MNIKLAKTASKSYDKRDQEYSIANSKEFLIRIFQESSNRRTPGASTIDHGECW